MSILITLFLSLFTALSLGNYVHDGNAYSGPACIGKPVNGCNCDNSRWECQEGYDALTTCPHGACFVSMKGQPTCGESYLCQPCTSDEDCLAPHEVCVWYGFPQDTECATNGYDCARQGSLCASTVLGLTNERQETIESDEMLVS